MNQFNDIFKIIEIKDDFLSDEDSNSMIIYEKDNNELFKSLIKGDNGQLLS